MKAVKIAGMIAVFVAANAMAYSTATWTVSGPASVAKDGTVPWAASVLLSAGPTGGGSTDISQGLSSYAITIELLQGGAAVPVTLNWANFTQSFNVGGAGPADARAINTDGGPGYEGPASAGTNSTLGKLAGVSAGYGLPWKYPRYTRGIGIPGAQASLGVSGAYVLNDGTIDLTGLDLGTYTVKLSVDSSWVLKTYKGTTTSVLNWDTTLTALPSETAVRVGSSFVFEIVPEPATMLLLAGAGLFLRRRHA